MTKSITSVKTKVYTTKKKKRFVEVDFKKKKKYIYILTYLLCVGTCVSLEVRGQLWELAPFFHHVGPGDPLSSSTWPAELSCRACRLTVSETSQEVCCATGQQHKNGCNCNLSAPLLPESFLLEMLQG
jgi:hypothetical protein